MEWISVKDRLPDNALVRVCCVSEKDDSVFGPFLAYYVKGYWWSYTCTGSPVVVTHYCDIPTLPGINPANKPINRTGESGPSEVDLNQQR